MAARKRRTVSAELTTSNADIYTAPARFNSDVYSILISNASSSEVTVSLDWYDSANTTYYTIAEAVKLKANSMIQITEYPVFLQKNDKIRGLASANSSITVTIAADEYFEETRFN